MRRLIETQYKEKIQQMTTDHQALVKELNEKYAKAQSDLNSVSEQHEMLVREKSKDSSTSERRLNDLLNVERKLQDQIDALKQDRDKRMVDHQEQLDKEKNSYKGKINEMEDKLRESDKKRQVQLFEFEKDKTKLSMKNDTIAGQLSEAQDNLKRCERKLEILNRDNVKLKSEVRQNRKNMYGGGSSSGNSFLGAAN